MLSIELTFLTGRFHATPWGRHVNEGVPEWPPSPYRLVRALYDVWKRKRPDWPQERVEPLLAALASSPPLFHLPQASVSHTRSFLSANKPSVTDRTLVFDAFVALVPHASVLVGWPEVSLEPQREADLNELLSLINFFGRSESWVRARTLSGITNIKWNCFPAADAPEGEEFEIIRVACPIPLSAYNARPYDIEILTGTGRRKKREKIMLPWLDALAWTTNDLLASLRSDPPAWQQVPYGRPAHCFEITPTSHEIRHKIPTHGVLYALESKVLPQVTSTLEIAERVRSKLMGVHKRVVGNPACVSPKFSGKEAGRRMIGHRHAYLLPLDRNRDGWLDHLLVYCREAFNQSERLALDQLNSLWQPDGKPDIRCTPLIWGKTEDLFKPATKVSSVTPFVPPRHYRRGRGDLADWLIAEVCRECSHHGLPQPMHVNFIQKLSVNGGRDFRWLEFRRNRQGDRAQMGYGFEMEFAQPVARPIALGYGCHFGLGLFLPV